MNNDNSKIPHPSIPPEPTRWRKATAFLKLVARIAAAIARIARALAGNPTKGRIKRRRKR